MKRLLLLLCAGWFVSGLAAAERIPDAPARYFNDYAGIVRRETADALNRQLEQAERDTSNQLVVVIYPRMESDSSVQDYTVRVAQAWKVGQQGRSNGAVLFAFMQSHDLYLQVGYGLEGAIPDAIAKRIVSQEIVPRFRAGDMDGGMTAAVQAMIAASKGEYHGTGQTQAERQRGRSGGQPLFVTGVFLAIFFFVLITVIRRGLRGGPTVFVNPRRRMGPVIINSNNWWNSGGGGSSGGGFFGGGGGGGGFSGGGGSFGGGGAGGKW